eukprot:5961519-Amphidinium_carterae.1
MPNARQAVQESTRAKRVAHGRRGYHRGTCRVPGSECLGYDWEQGCTTTLCGGHGGRTNVGTSGDSNTATPVPQTGIASMPGVPSQRTSQDSDNLSRLSPSLLAESALNKAGMKIRLDQPYLRLVVFPK